MNATANPASAKQLAFIGRLAVERGRTVSTENLTTREASALIAELLDAPRVAAPTTFEKVTGAAGVTEGMYVRDDRIFRVVRGREGGNLYAKELIDGKFEYLMGGLRFLSGADRMTLEQAAKYGQLTGTCCVCARELTNPASVAAGIGPVCSSRL